MTIDPVVKLRLEVAENIVKVVKHHELEEKEESDIQAIYTNFIKNQCIRIASLLKIKANERQMLEIAKSLTRYTLIELRKGRDIGEINAKDIIQIKNFTDYYLIKRAYSTTELNEEGHEKR